MHVCRVLCEKNDSHVVKVGGGQNILVVRVLESWRGRIPRVALGMTGFCKTERAEFCGELSGLHIRPIQFN